MQLRIDHVIPVAATAGRAVASGVASGVIILVIVFLVRFLWGLTVLFMGN